MTSEAIEQASAQAEEPKLTPVQEMEQRVNAAKAVLDAARAENREKVAILMATPADEQDDAWNDALTDAGIPVRQARDTLANLETQLEQLRAADRWNSNTALRSPIESALRGFVNAPLSVSAKAVTGTIRIVDAVAPETPEGEEPQPFEPHKVVNVSMSFRFAEPDSSSFAQSIIDAVDIDAMDAAELDALSFVITGIGDTDDKGTSKAVVRLNQGADAPRVPTTAPAAASKPAGGGAAAPRQGRIEWLYKGTWMSSREMLEAVEAAHESVVAEHAKAFDTTLRGTGYGLSNLAKAIGGKLSLQSRTS